MVVVDTNIIIDHLRQPDDELTYLRKLADKHPQKNLTISIITIQELYEGQSTKNEVRRRKLINTISLFRILNYTYEVAKLAGEIARDSTSKLDLADAAIAATAIINKAQLATLNKKDFQEIADLEFV